MTTEPTNEISATNEQEYYSISQCVMEISALQSERDQLKKELAETKRDVADAESHYINLGNELSLKLITANKVIDQCEEALKFYAQEWHTETGDLNYDLSIAVYTKAREALSTIQSLKLKGK